MKTWGHNPVRSYKKGKVLISCCGLQSNWLETEAEARVWQTLHTGVRETARRKR